jgi:hypothetical protein
MIKKTIGILSAIGLIIPGVIELLRQIGDIEEEPAKEVRSTTIENGTLPEEVAES